MESEWVRIAPFLGIEIPDNPVNDEFEGVKESKEVYEYFLSIDPEAPINSFLEFYNKLPITPKIGYSKMQQIMEAVRLKKLANKIKIQMESMGI